MQPQPITRAVLRDIRRQRAAADRARKEPGWRRSRGCPTKRHTIVGWRQHHRRHDMALGVTLMVLAVGMASLATALTVLSALG